jgi:3-phosphoshikimate 1-carboxyvinyltransferase
VDPVREAPHEAVLDCGESASTLRFLLPVACALGVDVRVTGGGRLPDRPIRALTDALRDHGVEVDSDRLPLRTRGRLAPGDYVMPGDVTSQYISGLLLALPLLEGPSRITLDSPLQSSPYVDMTLGTLELCGALIVRERDCFRVLPKRRFAIPATGMSVEGDWSNAAFFLAAGALGGGVTVKGLPGRTAQGDSRILDILSRMGAHVRTCDDDTVVHVTVRHGGLSGIDLDVSDVPDLLPILSIVSCAAEGATHLLNAGRLRMKESDRLSAMAEAITSLGGVVDERRDSLTVTGHILQGATVFSGGDHRVAMAVAIASTLCNGDVVLTGAESVNKSYPMFFDHFRRLGGRADVI